jgi:hypothetical protein
MSTTFAWSIADLERLTANGMIQVVHYTASSRSEDGAFAASACGSLGLDPADPGSMIPFADLTPEVVIGWVKDKFGAEKVAEIEAALQSQLDEQRNPSKQSGLPWAAAPAAA